MPDGRYEIAAEATVGAAPAEVMRWLTEPDLMSRWMHAVQATAADDGSVIVEASGGAYFGHTYRGEVVERSATRLVRRYTLTEMRGGVARMEAGPQEYGRTVTYELEDSTTIRCHVLTVIPGLAAAAERAGARAETRSLEASLDALRRALDGRRAKFRLGTHSPQPL